MEAGLARPTASGLSKPVEPYVLVVHTYIIQLQTDRDPATVGNSPWQLVSGELHSPEKLVDRKPPLRRDFVQKRPAFTPKPRRESIM